MRRGVWDVYEYDRESLIGTEYEYLLHEDYDEDVNASKSDSH